MVAPMNEEYTKKQQNRKLWNWCFSRCRCRETSETNMAAATRPEWMSGTLIHANLSAYVFHRNAPLIFRKNYIWMKAIKGVFP